jgi:hypothetical protein
MKDNSVKALFHRGRPKTWSILTRGSDLHEIDILLKRGVLESRFKILYSLVHVGGLRVEMIEM